jgi:hypothetical protein
MQAMHTDGPGIVLFVDQDDLPTPAPPPAPTAGKAPLPDSATEQGWPTWIAGVHTDGARNWYLLKCDAAPEQGAVAKYQRAYDPGPPAPVPPKINPDGKDLWVPNDNQRQGSCTFTATPYDY